MLKNEWKMIGSILLCKMQNNCFSCLQAIRILQKNGHLPSDPQIFESYAQYGIYRDVRLAALEALVDYIKGKYEFNLF